MCNIHGNRVNHDTLEHKGSGYVARHGEDFLMGNDPWFRGLNLAYGPDGGVYVSDWCDTGECHNYDRVDQSNGRIYKVTYGDVKLTNADLSKLSDEQLVGFQLHTNDWFVRHARRLLQERWANGVLGGAIGDKLRAILDGKLDVTRKLRALWALHDIGALSEPEILGGPLNSQEPYVRAWAIQLSLENGHPSEALLTKLTEMAGGDPSPVVRLYLASGLQRLAPQQRWGIATALCSHAEDVSDANLPLMIWYGIEPIVSTDRDRAAELLVKCKIPIVRESIARRIAQQ
jgi:hypothetical protein